MLVNQVLSEFRELARRFRNHLSLRNRVDRYSHQANVCAEAYVWARCASPFHISAEKFKFNTGCFAIADFARPLMGLQNFGQSSDSEKNHVISFTSITCLKLLAFDQLPISLLFSSACSRIIFLSRPFNRCLDVLFQVRLLGHRLPPRSRAPQ